MYNDVDRKEKNHMENNYWITLAQDETSAPEDTFLRIRELYNNLLKHLYDNPRDIPDFRIHFSTVQMSEEEGLNSGYHVATLTRRSREIAESVIHNVTEIPNFENSYTWYQDNIFVIFDYCGSGINPLQFVTRAFWEEVYKQLYFYGIRRVSIGHMYDLIISGGMVEFFYGFYHLDLNFLQNLSAETYEKKYADSRVIVPRNGTRAGKRTLKQGLQVAFSEPVAFAPENHRQIRKLLELSNDTLALIVDETGKVRGLSDKRAFPNECEIKIKGHLSWRIAYEGDRKLSYHNARYHINVERKADVDVSDIMKSVDPMLSPVELSRISNLIIDASRQKYGTILIFGKNEDIAAETERLTSAKVGIGISWIIIKRCCRALSRLTERCLWTPAAAAFASGRFWTATRQKAPPQEAHASIPPSTTSEEGRNWARSSPPSLYPKTAPLTPSMATRSQGSTSERFIHFTPEGMSACLFLWN